MLYSLFARKRPVLNATQEPNPFEVESLECRMMLSTVDIIATGQTGEEQFDLLIDGAVVRTYRADSLISAFSYTSEVTITADQIRIAFTNDLYDPENGIDRNLFIDRILVDDVEYETEAPTTFSSGYWNGTEIVQGFNQTEAIHANGYMQFLASGDEQLTFSGREWQRSNATDSREAFVSDGVMTLRGSTESAAVWTNLKIEPNQVYELSVDAWREVLAGTLSFDGQPWVTAGVDILNAQGELLSKQEIQLFGPTNPGDNGIRSEQFLTPTEAYSASIWVWAQQTPAGVDIPARIRDIQLNSVNSPDATPPQFELLRSAITQPTNEIQFTVNVTDESGIIFVDGPGEELTVRGPNGFRVSLSSIAGAPVDNGYALFFSLLSSFTSDSNGEYVVTANAGQFRDGVGNLSVETRVGSFFVNIPAAVG